MALQKAKRRMGVGEGREKGKSREKEAADRRGAKHVQRSPDGTARTAAAAETREQQWWQQWRAFEERRRPQWLGRGRWHPLPLEAEVAVWISVASDSHCCLMPEDTVNRF